MSELCKNVATASGNPSGNVAIENDIRRGALSSPKPQNRIVELDALRGLAALAVVLFHYTTRFDQMFGRGEPLVFSLPWGVQGVELFFMLSGYVILMTLDRTMTVVEFVVGRFSRLYPAYWAAAILTYSVVLWAELPGQMVSLRDLMLNLTMVPALLKAKLVDGAYWTLQAELLFYGAMLLLHRVGAFRKLTMTLAVWLSLAAGMHIALGIGAGSPFISSVVPKLQTLASLKFIHLFAIGITFYDLRRTGCSLAHAALLLYCFSITLGISTNLQTAIIILLATLLLAAVSGHSSFLTAWPFVKLGQISYTLYLVHENIGFVTLRWLYRIGCEPHLAVFMTIAGAIALAATISTLVERPAQRAIRAALKTKMPRPEEVPHPSRGSLHEPT